MYVDMVCKFRALVEEKYRIDVKRIILNVNQDMFESIHDEIPVPLDLTEEEQFEFQNKYKDKVKGLMLFISELFQSNVIQGRVVLRCMSDMMKGNIEYKLECLCLFIKNSGNFFLNNDKTKPKDCESFTNILNKFSALIQGDEVSTRLKCLIKDIIDLRQTTWLTPENTGDTTGASSARPAVSRTDSLRPSGNNSQIGFTSRTQSYSSLQHVDNDGFQAVKSKRGQKGTTILSRVPHLGSRKTEDHLMSLRSSDTRDAIDGPRRHEGKNFKKRYDEGDREYRPRSDLFLKRDTSSYPDGMREVDDFANLFAKGHNTTFDHLSHQPSVAKSQDKQTAVENNFNNP